MIFYYDKEKNLRNKPDKISKQAINMTRQWILIAMACTLSFTVCAQDKKNVQGKIVADSLLESSVHIINKSLQRGTVNKASGHFTIEVRVNDTPYYFLLYNTRDWKFLLPKTFFKMVL